MLCFILRWLNEYKFRNACENFIKLKYRSSISNEKYLPDSEDAVQKNKNMLLTNSILTTC